MNHSAGRVLAFDSGIGGLGVVRALRDTLPSDTHIDYLADNALFPYGEQDDARLIARIIALLDAQIARLQPDVVLIACNTASTIALDPLRARFGTPFVGCVPPVRWAARVSRSRVFGVLATRGTARRPYLRALQEAYASDCEMIVHGARALADLAERAFLGQRIEDAAILDELAHLFSAPSGERIDTVGLGCTHYTFLAEAFARLSPPDVAWLDPALPVAQQVRRVLEDRPPAKRAMRAEEMCLTAPPPDREALDRAVNRLGYERVAILDGAVSAS
ncbi:glutamate racemase [Swaminathania salitolerans]|uniref:Glutamate racemase n=1 Tax=Swaminathania salitolerans TaxID=182838 RepID=A0A511BUK0_9PROT|nr:glutamate racemase [Swaminathania salitolerans]GBQ16218.1 glutamate racemase [Swaminathania salitolerans LMG 21291]GEL01638.1 glutamate racemase [Swaminathania salitolerans]